MVNFQLLKGYFKLLSISCNYYQLQALMYFFWKLWNKVSLFVSTHIIFILFKVFTKTLVITTKTTLAKIIVPKESYVFFV